MNFESRPDPDVLLKAIQRDEDKQKHGRLKIFLGMAAGVGKTYAMLEAAQRLKRQGVDVVVGIANTHGRKETAALLNGLKIVPEKQIVYKNRSFGELNVEEIIRLRPQLAIVDELAHTNTPGSTHPKRWLDVVDLLEEGIDVYTTLNIQHIESLKDIVEGITGVTIRETVPDLIIEKTDNIELIDLTPEELLQRLKEGKVYIGNQATIAAQNFFQEDRLTALRELVLRFAAEKVDHDLHHMIMIKERAVGWKPRDRLLVGVSATLDSETVIRTARRLSFTLDAPWTVIYVDSGKKHNQQEEAILEKNLLLARQLGAEVMTTYGSDIAEEIAKVALEKGVTQIILGRARQNRWFTFPFFSISHRIARKCHDIELHIIPLHETTESSYIKSPPLAFARSNLFSYLAVIVLVGFLTGLNWLLAPFIGYQACGLIFLTGILFTSPLLRGRSICLAGLLSALAWDYFFIPSSWLIPKSGIDSILLILFLCITTTMGIIVGKMRLYRELLAKREETTRALYDIVHLIATTPSISELIQSVCQRMGKILNGTCDLVIKNIDGNIDFSGDHPLIDTEKQQHAVLLVSSKEHEIGWSTDTLPENSNFYMPLKGFNETVGVMIYRPNDPNTLLDTEKKNLIYTVGKQLASYLERSLQEEKQRLEEQKTQTEKIHKMILKLISHEFQSPILSLQEAVEALRLTPNGDFTKETPLFDKIENCSDFLGRIVDNISVMAKLSSGFIPVNKKRQSIHTLVHRCCDHIKKTMNHHKLEIHVSPDLPKILFDFSLMEMLLCNLLSNALKFSPQNTTVEVSARMENSFLILSVADRGKGIPEDEIDTIFEKFYRLPGTLTAGVGLGLAIVKSVSEIHHGHLKVENRKGGGARFSFYLPME